MADNLKPIQISISTTGANEAVKSINSVISSLQQLQLVSKSVTKVMTNFGNTKIYNQKFADSIQIANEGLLNIGKTTTKLTSNVDSYNKVQVKNTKAQKDNNTQIGKTIKSYAKLFASMFSIRKVSNYLADAMDESAAWVENINVMEVAFGNLSDSAYKFVKSVSGGLGLNENELLKYVSLFQQMASAMGQSEKSAYLMSTSLTLLGTDIASLYNVKTQTAMEALRSAIAGQVKPVRQFGLDITSYSIDALLEDMGLAGEYSSKMMSQSQKQLARTILLIQQSKNAWGDLGKTINTYANQQKILSAQFTNLKRAIGDLFVGVEGQAGIAAKVLYRINGLLMAIVETIRAFIPQASSSGLNQVTDDIKNVEEEAEDLEETLNGSLLSFDKFNTLSQGNDAGDDVLSETLDKQLSDEYTLYLKQWNERMEAVNSEAHKIRDTIMEWLGFTKAVDTTTDKFGNTLSTVKFTLNEGYTNIKKIRDVLIAIVGIIATLNIMNKITKLTNSVKEFHKSLESIRNGLSLIASHPIILVIGAVVAALAYLYTTNEQFRASVNALFQSLGQLFNVAIEPILGVLQSLSPIISILLQQITSILNVLTPIINAIANMLSWGLVKMVESLTKKITPLVRIFEFFMKIVETILNLLGKLQNTVINKSFQNIKDFFGGIWNGITNTLRGKSYSRFAFADGGYPDAGQMFIANERGAELVGNIGGRTAVASNDMIVQAIENASYRGMLRALSSNGGSNNVSININANSNDLSRALAKSMAIELQRQGYRI